MDGSEHLVHSMGGTMPTTAALRVSSAVERQRDEPGAADMLSHFAAVASAERDNPGRGMLWGLFLGSGLWVGIFALAFWLLR